MRYLIIEHDEAFEKFEIDKSWLVKVKDGHIDMIIDTEEGKYFAKGWLDDEPQWHDLKPYDRKYKD